MRTMRTINSLDPPGELHIPAHEHKSMRARIRMCQTCITRIATYDEPAVPSRRGGLEAASIFGRFREDPISEICNLRHI